MKFSAVSGDGLRYLSRCWRGVLTLFIFCALAQDGLAGCFSAAPDSICIGATNTYSVVPPVSATSYTWTLTSDTAGTTFVGVTNTDTIQLVAAAGGSFSIQCAVTSGTNVLTCATNVTVLQPLSITPLTNQTVCPASSVTFSTAASGGGTLAFQWKKNGDPISGATTDTLTLTNVTPADTGDFSIEVAGPCGSATNIATLMVTPPPVITFPTNVALNFLAQ